MLDYVGQWIGANRGAGDSAWWGTWDRQDLWSGPEGMGWGFLLPCWEQCHVWRYPSQAQHGYSWGRVQGQSHTWTGCPIHPQAPQPKNPPSCPWNHGMRPSGENQSINYSLSLSPSYTQRLTQISKSLIFWLSSFYLVGNLRWKLPSTWMQWTKLLTHGTCPSHTQEPFRTLAWRRGEEGLRTWRRLKILFFSGQRPTLLLSLASIPVRESLRSPSKECSWRVMSTKPFNLLHGWTR